LGTHNIIVNNVDARTTTLTTSNQTIQLTLDSSFIQLATGTTSNIFYNLPNATTLNVGASFQFNNNTTSGTISVRNFGVVNTIATIAAGGAVQVVLLSNTTTTGTWDVLNYGPKNASGGTDSLSATSTKAKFSSLVLGTPLTVANGGADSTTYYTKYRSDTSRNNIYGAINGKQALGDSATYYTKYRSDTSRNNIYAGINGKLNISDTATMLSPYAKNNLVATKLNAVDTASLSSRIDNKMTGIDILKLMSYGIKAEPYGVTLGQMTNQLGLTTNRFYLYPFYWNTSDSIRGVSFFSRAALTNVATNYNGIAIYSLSGGTLTRLVQTANDGTFWNTTINTWSSKSITPTFLAKGLYFVGYQFSGAPAPTIGAGDPLVIASTESPSQPPSSVNTNGIKFSTFIANLTSSAPTSIAMSATTAVVNVPYFLFY
jgi:hypothetical protein